jgi:ribonuclease HII
MSESPTLEAGAEVSLAVTAMSAGGNGSDATDASKAGQGNPAGKGATGTKAAPTKTRKRATVAPTLKFEREFMASGVRLLAGVDEVGRGALAGPVSVGIAVVDLENPRRITGVRDSKLLKPEDRERLEPRVRAWAVASAVGHATSREIDLLGLTAALRLAGTRAWEQVLAAGVVPDAVLLDGSHNWLSPSTQGSLFDEPGVFGEPDVVDDPDELGETGIFAEPGVFAVPKVRDFSEPPKMVAGAADMGGPGGEMPMGIPCDAPVHTRVKADLSCLSVAAASVLAKVARDRMMKTFHLEYPGFGWDENKGYATPAHREALQALGPSPHHRISWNIL